MGGQNSKAKKKEFGRKLFKIYDINNDGEITKDEERGYFEVFSEILRI